jgi:hypothetical protein
VLIFGHLGIGSHLVRLWNKELPKKMVLLGTILPDLIDKPIYYIPSFITGKTAAQLGLIHGTQTFAHTGLFLILLSSLAILRKSKALVAISLGVATHLLLDSVIDEVIYPFHLAVPIFWPLPGWEFPIARFHSATEHLRRHLHPAYLLSEVIGLFLLLTDSPTRRRLSHIQTNR